MGLCYNTTIAESERKESEESIMKDYMYKATGLIQETFDEKGIKYQVDYW